VTDPPEHACTAFGVIAALTAGRGLVTAEAVLPVQPAADGAPR
jgi:hypothetical protein